MNTQVNVRLPEQLMKKATNYAQKHGFNNVQDLMKESLRERVHDETTLPKNLYARLLEFEKNIVKKKLSRKDLGF